MKLNSKQYAATLRKEFNSLRSIPLHRANELSAIMDKANDETVVFLAGAGIKFVSPLARLRARRRKLVVPDRPTFTLFLSVTGGNIQARAIAWAREHGVPESDVFVPSFVVFEDESNLSVWPVTVLLPTY
jgi:hypothetical protein